MAHEVETMAYAGEKPWHGLGKEVPGDLTPKQMLKAAGLDWTVSKQPMFLKGGAEIPDQYALVRDTDQKVLSVVGSIYKPTQNEQVLEFFRKFTEAGNMDMETAGSLQGGKYVWALARLKADFTLGKDDEMKSYLLFCNPHLYGYSRTIKFTSVRVVCWNTVCMALGEHIAADGKKQRAYSIPHSIDFDAEMQAKVEESLGLGIEQAKEFEQAARLLSKKKFKSEKVEKYFADILNYDPEKAKRKLDGSVREPAMLNKFREALETSPGADLKSAKGTWWGALNAVTYVVDHQVGRTRDGALSSAWLGQYAEHKTKALKLALAEAA